MVRTLTIPTLSLLLASLAQAQSDSALRFYGTGINQQDRVRIQIDDDGPGPDVSAPCDIGAGDFTIEFWLRGTTNDNTTGSMGGDVETFNLDWIYGNIVIDRDIWDGSYRDWGISIAGGFVRFGTGPGDPAGAGWEHTLEGDVNVLDGAWHHVACVRVITSGIKRIYVDGVLDFESSAGNATWDISFPDGGAPGQNTPWGQYIFLGAEKHDADVNQFPSFDGYFDELRIWERALGAAEVASLRAQVIPASSPGLVGYYRFEEEAGTVVADSSGAGSPTGELIAGTPGNGEWVLASADPLNVAPVSASGCDGEVDGDATVDVSDISYVIFRLGNTGVPGTVDGDADRNGVVDVNDVSFVIFRLGPCP